MTKTVALSRRGLLLTGGAAMLATPFLGKGARAATTLRYGHMHTPASIAGAQAEWFAEAVREKTGGEIAAGALIAREAGAIVTDHLGGDWRFNRPDPRQTSLICSAPALHPLILERTGAIPRAS